MLNFYELKSLHLQALAQSDIILSKLGVSRENVDDSAGAAQVICGCLISTLILFSCTIWGNVPSWPWWLVDQYVASHGLRDAGVVASARAAEIYGLNILAERIQVTHCLALF